jgi:pimeloyl-ACP methyl ester carboxylesterase
MKTIRVIFLLIVFMLSIFIMAFWHSDLKTSFLEQKYTDSSSQFIHVEGDRIHFRDTGNPNGPVIVFIHGFGASLHTWQDWSNSLGQDYRVIRFDLPGFGLTGPDVQGNYSDDRTNEIILGLMQRLKVQKIVLVGHSIGGRIAWYFAAKHPELIAKLVLIAPDGFESPGMSYGKAPQIPSYMNAMEYIFPEFIFKQNLEFAYTDKNLLTDPLFNRYYELALYPGNRKAMLERMRQTVLKDPHLYLKDIHCPVLLLWGVNDRMIPIDHAKDYLVLMPQAKLQRVPNIGHLPQEEDWAIALQFLKDFIKEK